MDFSKLDLGSIMTVLNFLALILFGISDMRKRHSESNKTDTDAADRITESALKMLEPKDKQIQQQNDQILRLLNENQQLAGRFTILHLEFTRLQGDFETVKTVLLQKESEYNKVLVKLAYFEQKLREANIDVPIE